MIAIGYRLRLATLVAALLATLACGQPAVGQEAVALATPAVEIATVTGELLGQASACRAGAKRLERLEARIKTALGRAAANQPDYEYALTRYGEEKASGAERQRRNRTGIDCELVHKSVAELERRRF